MNDDCTPKPPPDPRADVDWRLRGAFQPEPGAVARVARAALVAEAAAPPSARRMPRLRWVGVAAAAVVVIVSASIALRPSPTVRSPEQATVVAGAPSLTGSFTDGVLVVSLPDGSVSIIGGGARDGRPPDGYGIVLVEGELR